LNFGRNFSHHLHFFFVVVKACCEALLWIWFLV
jgi:hypothetical protein